jgi:hypothetical protein
MLLPSAPLVTVQVVPETLVTVIISVGCTGSAILKYVLGTAVLLAAGKAALDETVRLLSPLLAVVPPAVTVTDGLLA